MQPHLGGVLCLNIQGNMNVKTEDSLTSLFPINQTTRCQSKMNVILIFP